MKVWVMSLENSEEDSIAEVFSISYSPVIKQFSMPCPTGDDYLQSIFHTPEPSPELVRLADKLMAVIFKANQDAKKFSDWLLDANSRAVDGFKTMRG